MTRHPDDLSDDNVVTHFVEIEFDGERVEKISRRGQRDDFAITHTPNGKIRFVPRI